MDRLRTPFLIAAIVLFALAFGLDIGASWLPKPTAGLISLGDYASDMADADIHASPAGAPPGLAIPALAILDGLVLVTAGLMGTALFVPAGLQGRVQGIVNLIVSILAILAGILQGLAAFALLLIMFSLFIAVPFGTIAYLVVWGSFDRSGAATILSFSLLLKLVGAVCLPLAHQRYLQNVGFILLLLTSILGDVIISFLHGLLPRVLCSITDAVGAIVVAVLGILWAIVFLVGAVIAIVKVLRGARTS